MKKMIDVHWEEFVQQIQMTLDLMEYYIYLIVQKVLLFYVELIQKYKIENISQVIFVQGWQLKSRNTLTYKVQCNDKTLPRRRRKNGCVTR